MIFSLKGSVRNHQLCLHSRCRHTESLSLLACLLRGRRALWVTSMHKWLPIRKGGRGGGREAEREEEVQYFVLLNLWEGRDDTRRHQLNMFCISEQFLCC